MNGGSSIARGGETMIGKLLKQNWNYQIITEPIQLSIKDMTSNQS
jgi:hypothetical protein